MCYLAIQNFSDGRVSALKVSGSYYKDGQRYPDTEYGNSPLLKKAAEIKIKKTLVTLKR
ncbi:hypothetical protein QM027_08020 [Campylobacter concisus]